MSRQFTSGCWIVLVLVGILMSALPSHAQDDGAGLSAEELALLAEVQIATAAFRELESVGVTQETVILTSFNNFENGQGLANFQAEAFEGVVQFDEAGLPIASQGTARITLNTAGPLEEEAENGVIDGEIIVVEGVIYRLLVALSGNVTVAEATGEWVSFNEQMVALSDSEDPPTFEQLAGAVLGARLPLLDLDAAWVTSIVELESITQEGQVQRVFEITLDPPIAREKLPVDQSNFVVNGLRGIVDRGGDYNTQTGVLGASASAASFIYRVWLAEGQVVASQWILDAESQVLNPDQPPLDLEVFWSVTTTFNAFNEPVTIEAPIVAE